MEKSTHPGVIDIVSHFHIITTNQVAYMTGRVQK
jgi:hypothetical protein